MIELLAPAGSYEALQGALDAGADAVYVGGTSFGARAYAQNFTQEELLDAIDLCHIYGKKLYLTVNTLLKNRELQDELYDYILPYYERGLDGVIVQDFGVLSFLKKHFPDLRLHGSTQMTVTGLEGMRFLEKQGAVRVVPARELSLEELTRMHQECSLELEVFIHGALCYCYSGQCLFSSILGGRSGNRGRCAQPCRLPYDTALENGRYSGKKDLCPLSPKDICTLDILPEILKTGVASLKIEGRMKKPGYTTGVVSVYRKYLDLYEKDPENYQVEPADRQFLLDIFSRGGSCEGYYHTQNGPEMMAFTNEKKSSGVSVEIRKKKEKVYGNLILFPWSPAILEVKCRGYEAVVTAGEVQEAKNQPMDRERICRQMDRCGDEPFQWEKLEVQMEDGIFVPVKLLNELRRNAFAQLKAQMLKPYERHAVPRELPARTLSKREELPEPLKMYASCEKEGQLRVLLDTPEIRGIYCPLALAKNSLDEVLRCGKEFYLAMPWIVRGKLPEGFWACAEALIERGMTGFLVSSLEAYGLIQERGYGDRCVLDHSMYTWNDEAVAFWRSQGIRRMTVPVELNYKELLHRDNRGGELLVYGYLPLMVSAQCVRKNLYGCNGKQETLCLKDRYGKEFPVLCTCQPWDTLEKPGKYCFNRIYNSIPLGLQKEHQQAERLGVSSVRLSFTVESEPETRGIVRDFVNCYVYKRDVSAGDFTKGHFKRGVE